MVEHTDSLIGLLKAAKWEIMAFCTVCLGAHFFDVANVPINYTTVIGVVLMITGSMWLGAAIVWRKLHE